MSVFIRTGQKDNIYSYDFRIRGHRFSGSTGRTTRREAQQVEEAERRKARELLKLENAATTTAPTIELACARYWNEVGQHLVNSQNRLWALGWLVDYFGGAKRIADIDDAAIAAMVAKRRGENIPNRKTPTRISNATVNRTVTEPMKDIWHRARHIWKTPTADINWRAHILTEPAERVREASQGEETAIADQLERGYEDALAFAFKSGCRRAEIISLVWARVDFFSRQFVVIGKGNRKRTIPMSAEIYDLLWAQRGHHAEFVFTFEAKRTLRMKDGRKLIRGQRYPLTDSGLKSAAKRATRRAGVADFRFHDTRHTAATRVLRKSNLLVVQKLLGHADPSTTAKYAHVLREDVRAALDAADATNFTTDELIEAAKWLAEQKKKA